MHVSFDSNCERLLIGSNEGVEAFQVTHSAATAKRQFHQSSLGAVALVAIEESSGTIVAVLEDHANPHSSHRRVVLWDRTTSEILSELQFEERVLSIKVNELCLVVILEKRTHFFEWESLAPMPQLVTANPPNSRGLGALSGVRHSRKGEIAYFAGTHTDAQQTRGDIALLELPSNRLMLIAAHNSNPIAAIELSGDGTCIATASSKGTVIRVFRVDTGEMLFNFRRGKSEVVVESLTFSPSNLFLAVGSSSSTLHVFSCDPATNSGGKEVPSFAKLPVKERTKYTIGLLDGSDRSLTVFAVARPTASEVAAAMTRGKVELTMEVLRVEEGTGNFKKLGDTKLR